MMSESRGAGWNFFAAVAFVFMPDNRPLFKLWELRSVARDAWLEAGGCERCRGVWPFCTRCLASQKPSAGIDPMLSLDDIERLLRGTPSRRSFDNPELTFMPPETLVAPGEQITLSVDPQCLFRLEHMVVYGSDQLDFQLIRQNADGDMFMIASGRMLTGLTFHGTTGPICQPGSVIRLTVDNRGAVDRLAHVHFRGHQLDRDNQLLGRNIRWREFFG